MIAAHGLERFVSDLIIEGSLGDTTSHTTTRMTGRMTMIARVSGRRLWTVDQKLLMLRDAFGSGGGVRTVMKRHEVSSGQLYTWRKQAMSRELSGADGSSNSNVEFFHSGLGTLMPISRQLNERQVLKDAET
jgi:transposase-like protein